MAVTIPITKTKITTQWGTSVSTDITELKNTLTELQQTGGGITIETAIDAVAAALKPGNNIDITYDDELGTITVHVEPLTKADVSLGNVDNTSDANKPISTATQTALDTKAEAAATTTALSGKQPLDTELTVIAGLDTTSDHVIQSFGSSWASRTPTQLKSTLGLTKTDVGLGNVNNTSDLNAPVSTAQQAALDAKMTIPVWTNYTPTLSNWAIGNGSIVGRYMQFGKLITFAVYINFGSSSTYTGSPYISLPFASTVTWPVGRGRAQAHCAFYDATGSAYPGWVDISGSNGTPLVWMPNPTYVANNSPTSTIPFTWTTGDGLQIYGSYEAA